MTDAAPTMLDKRSARAAFNRSAGIYDSAAVLQREVADRLVERLDLIRCNPTAILDMGSGTGYCTRALAHRYPGARVIGVDVAPAMVRTAAAQVGWFMWVRRRARERYICGDAESLPIAPGSVDMVISNLMLQWCAPDAVFAEIARVLRPGGLFMFTSFGPDTLRELRAAWMTVDGYPHVHDFIDMHDLGDALVRAHFADPVMDVERITLTYPGVIDVLRDLKSIGAHNAAHGRNPGLTGKRLFAKFRESYEAMAAPDGRIPASYEVVHGHAWAPQPGSGSHPQADGTISIPVSRVGHRRP
ncbi:MAG: malonyl-ACP O-methyltransferase BioC [Acidiferrobacterales bacterium]